MIQRIQSIYLFLAAAALSCPLFLPLAQASGDTTSMASLGDNFFTDGVYWAKESLAWFGLFLLVLGGLAGIFLYKNRKRQMQFTSGLFLGTLVLLGVLLGGGYQCARQLPLGSAAQISMGGIVILLAIPLLWLAHRSIKKDEELVRSSDRLR